MKTDIEVKPISIDCPSLAPLSYFGYSRVEIDRKEGKCAFTGIAPSDIKIELDLEHDDDDDDLPTSCTNNEAGKQSNGNKSGFGSYYVKYVNPTKNCESNGILKYTTLDGKERYKCEICSRRFKSRKYTLKHMKFHAEGKIKEVNYKCEICDKWFLRKQQMMQHKKRHTCQANYKCEICTKRFTLKRYLTKHSRTHPRERKYECEACPKRFLTKQAQMNHFRTHSKECKYECEICGKRLKTKQGMSGHVNAHSKERKFRCKMCTECFTSKVELLDHLKNYTHDKNYECKIYKQRTSKMGYLSQHIKETKHKCEVCNQHFEERKLLEHTNTHIEEYISANLTKQISQFNEMFVKNEIGTFAKKDNLDTKNDSIKIGTTENCIDTDIKEEKPKSIEILGLWQTLNDEIIIKEEHVTDVL